MKKAKKKFLEVNKFNEDLIPKSIGDLSIIKAHEDLIPKSIGVDLIPTHIGAYEDSHREIIGSSILENLKIVNSNMDKLVNNYNEKEKKKEENVKKEDNYKKWNKNYTRIAIIIAILTLIISIFTFFFKNGIQGIIIC